MAGPAPLDFGAPAASGTEAVGTIEARRMQVISALACGDEAGFVRSILVSGPEKGEWPTTQLIAKAGYVARYVPRGDVHDGCSSAQAATIDEWVELLNRAGHAPGDRTPAEVNKAISAYYTAAFGPDCAGMVFAHADGSIGASNSSSCLVLQVSAVLLNPSVGRWKYENGRQIPVNPGTDKLPCVTGFPFGSLDGGAGDWDMAVLEYTRMIHLLDRAVAQRPLLRSGKVMEATTRADRFLLTLRGGPAEETYDLLTSCGNPDNSHGTADNFLGDQDAHDATAKRVVGGDEGDSFWKSLWRLLKFLAPLLAVAALALAIGMAIGGAVATIGSAIATTIVGAVIVAGAVSIYSSGIEETENHLLMQNSSKYLKNKRMLGELQQAGNREGFNRVSEMNEDVRRWLLKRMQRIVKEDFREFNSKPYNRLSLWSLLNLRDFACDRGWDWFDEARQQYDEARCDSRDTTLRDAADAVLDLAAAKVALGSSQGRRLITFRRQAKENWRYASPWPVDGKMQPPRHFSDLFGGADHLLAALQYWTGVTRHGPGGRASSESISHMLWHASSRYLPEDIVLDLAVDRSTPFMQTLTHGGFERYSSGPGWLITAGGTDTTRAQGVRVLFGLATLYLFGPDDDFGVGVPTTLMANGSVTPRDTYDDLLRFEGQFKELGSDGESRLVSYSANRCVAEGFACGLGIKIPQPIEACLSPSQPATATLRFIDSAACPEYRDGDRSTANDFYLVVYQDACVPIVRDRSGPFPPGCEGSNWGFFEVVDAVAAGGSFQAFTDRVTAANAGELANWRESGGTSTITYHSAVRGRTLRFVPVAEDFDADCRACGDVIEEEDDARFRIRNPRSNKTILIDLSDVEKPVRDVR